MADEPFDASEAEAVPEYALAARLTDDCPALELASEDWIIACKVAVEADAVCWIDFKLTGCVELVLALEEAVSAPGADEEGAENSVAISAAVKPLLESELMDVTMVMLRAVRSPGWESEHPSCELGNCRRQKLKEA